MAAHDRLGDRLGPRLADIVAEKIIAVNRDLTDHKAQVITSGIERLLDLIGAEMQPHIGPLLADLAEHPDIPAHVADGLRFIGTHRGEAASLGRFLFYASGVGSGIGTLLNASLAPAIQQALAHLETGLHDPGTAAQLVTLGILPKGQAIDEASRQNLDQSRFEEMIEGAYVVPPIPDLLAMLNRGLLDGSNLPYWLGRGGLHPSMVELIPAMQRQIIPPDSAADMVVRGIITEPEGAAIAAQSGVHGEDFARMVLDTGEPLALEQLLLLYRRGQIDQAHLEHGIRQSRVKNEWIPAAIDLRFAPPSASDAIRAAVQNQLPDAAARRYFAEAGLDPVNFDWMLRTAGRPPGTEQMIELWHRGHATEGDVKQAIRESDIKDKYVDQLVGLAEYFPPVRSIAALLHSGAITDAQAAGYYAKQGVGPTLIQQELASAHHGRTSTARHLANATIVKLYHEQALDTTQATHMLEGVGWSPTDAAFILAAEDLNRAAQAIDRAVSHVHSLYVGYRLERSAAVSALHTVGLPDAQVTHILSSWDLERVAAAPTLTRAQVTAAFKWKIIDQATALAKLEGLGYTTGDATILLEIATHHPLGAP